MTAPSKLLAASGLLLAAALPSQTVLAQGQDSAGADTGPRASEEIITVGTRRREGRTVTDSLVPVDLISGDDIRGQGSTDMDRLLANLVPSYSVNRQPINDGATLVRPAQLRGLPPDAALVLVNGKRRHRASVITFLGNGVADGSQGPDLLAIPSIALERVEVLRDGAAAQYGSDAIAGVINFQLRQDTEGFAAEAQWGQHYEGDGALFGFAANAGFALGDNGFVNLSFEYRQSDPTDRARQRPDAVRATAAGNPHVEDPSYPHIFHPHAQVWGSPEFEEDYKLFANFGEKLGSASEIYGHVNYAKREVVGGFFWRNPHTRDGVFEADVVNDANNEWVELQAFERDDDGKVVLDDAGNPIRKTGETRRFGSISALLNEPNETVRAKWQEQLMADGITVDDLRDTVKVANLHSHNGSMNDGCDPIRIDNGLARATDVMRIAGDDDCDSFILRFPGGFTPRFGGVVRDFSVLAGIRSDVGGWFLDASFVHGRHQTVFFMQRTINPQVIAEPEFTAANMPTDYEPGTYTQTDSTFNFDASRDFALAALESPLHLGIGFEYRSEEFQVTRGDDNAWFQDCEPKAENGQCAPTSLTNQGFAIGTNGFPGFGPRLEGAWSRNSWALYADLEADVTKRLTLGLALRHEDHEEVGATTDGKLSARISVNDAFAIRGAFSTGFRAPTVGQANVLNVTTTFTGVMLQDEATLPPALLSGIVEGATPLTPEESTNYTLGAVFNWSIFDITLDLFRIELEGRIARSSEKTLNDAQKDALQGRGIADAANFSVARFYTNDFDTTTQGADLVVSWQGDLFGRGGTTDFSLAGNYTSTEVTRRDPAVIGLKRVVQLEENLPKTRFTLSANHIQGPWNFIARVRHYGGFTEFAVDSEANRLDAEARTLVDLEAAYRLDNGLTFILGADNVFDIYPSRQTADEENLAGMQYSETSPFGFNGGYYYLRARWEF